MLQIGLTGGIGSGKSTVAAILEKMGYPVFYSDNAAKSLYESNSELKQQLKNIVGEEVYLDGCFQKEVLAKHIFDNPELKVQITALVHPLVRASFQKWADQKRAALVFNEAAILFETGAYRQFKANILVSAPIELRIQRIEQRDRLDRTAILQRMANQWPEEQKKALTSYHIQNDGQPLLIQVEKLVDKLLKLKES